MGEFIVYKHHESATNDKQKAAVAEHFIAKPTDAELRSGVNVKSYARIGCNHNAQTDEFEYAEEHVVSAMFDHVSHYCHHGLRIVGRHIYSSVGKLRGGNVDSFAKAFVANRGKSEVVPYRTKTCKCTETYGDKKNYAFVHKYVYK